MFVNNQVTDVQGPSGGGIPSAFILHQNYPNPFNSLTTISYELPRATNVTIKVYDVFGREVMTLVDGFQDAGFKSVEWSAKGGSASGGDASDVASGVYFYRLQADNFNATKKFILLK